MVDRTLSEAVTLYIWGRPARSWPSRHLDAVTAQFGTAAAADLLPRVYAVVAELDASPDWSRDDLAQATARVAVRIRHRYPELTEDAVRAVCALFSYGWR